MDLIVGPLLRLLHWSLDRRGRGRDRRTAASDAFRAVVLEELAGLYPVAAPWPEINALQQQLNAAFPALQAAVATYRPYVADKEAFDQAWLWYRSATKRDLDSQCYQHYTNITTTTTDAYGGDNVFARDGRANFKRNVDRLLSFADVR